jgi:hypothetical protein
MKKMLSILLKKLLPLVCVICMLSGCVVVQAAVEIGGVVAEAVDAAKEPGRAKAFAVERAQQFSKGGASPFSNAAEERLTRRSSTLAGGIPVDVSPFLVHKNSFTVTENGIQHFRSILDFAEVYHDKAGAGFALNGFALFEFDTAITFEADNQKRQMNASAAVSAASQSKAKEYVKKYMRQYAAERVGLEPKALKNYKIQFLKTRKGKAKFGFRFDNVFVHTIKPGYVQFDVEVEYQKKKNSFMGFNTDLKPEHFAVFNQVYRSDFTSVEAAAVDVQGIIWRDARKKGFKETPLPVINVVRAASFTQ